MFIHQTQAKGIVLELVFDATVPDQVLSDSRRFAQVLINLISNSLKFTMEGSINISISFDKSNNNLNIVVSDTGVGINKKELT